jgi:TolB-like protein/DNA-binding winged helix-turn-helix (wHTH) protein/tetratricopeptide (TPR) repeat protein
MPDESRVFRVGDWRVDPELDELSREGQTIRVEPRTMQLLVYLAAHAGRVVDVQQLLDQVWSNVVVTQGSVYQAIAQLRRILGDDSERPTYIENLPRRGYRLIASVAPWDASCAAATDSRSIAQASTHTAGGSGAQPQMASDELVSAGTTISEPLSGPPPAVPTGPSRRRAVLGAITLGMVIVAGIAIGTLWRARQVESPSARAAGSEITVSAVTPTIAVLPFVDLSDSKDQQYFVDGLTEELIERLAQVPRLHVVARSSSSYFRGRQAIVSEIARTLGATHLLEGSVRKSGTAVRITTHLVRANDGYELWSETYDRPLTDIFKVQDAIAGAVVRVLRLSIVPSTLTSIPNLTMNADAHVEFLRALPYQDNGTGADYDAAESHLHSALLLDPQFATAWALLSEVTVWKFEGRAANPSEEACARARSAATRALELNPALVLAHRARGIVLHSCDRDLQAAEAEFDQALKLKPDDELVLISKAWLKCDMGQADRAIEFARRATEVDPLNPWTFAALGGVTLHFSHADEAEAALRKAVNMDTDSSAAYIHSSLAVALLTNDRLTEAVAESEREPDPQIRAMLLPIVLDAAGRRADAERQLAELKHRYGTENPDWIGLFYACRHDARQAVPWLRAYATTHTGWMGYQPYLRACLRNLVGDPSYRAFEQQIKATNMKRGWPPMHCDPWW